MILRLLRKDRVQSQAETLYAAIAEQARAPGLYLGGGTPDTLAGRFDQLALHVFLLLRRLKREGQTGEKLSIAVQQFFFQRLDDALRELGVGDLSVGKKIRSLAEAFYGRAGAYEKALAEDGGALAAALARNVLETERVSAAEPLARYVRAADAALAAAPFQALESAVRNLREQSALLESEDAHAKP
jgi:cytochrome b pre-mRNA-processing protein 3